LGSDLESIRDAGQTAEALSFLELQPWSSNRKKPLYIALSNVPTAARSSFSNAWNAPKLRSGRKSSIKSATRCAAAARSKRLDRRPVRPEASSSSWRSTSFGSGMDSSWLVTGMLRDILPLGLPAAVRIAFSSMSSQASAGDEVGEEIIPLSHTSPRRLGKHKYRPSLRKMRIAWCIPPIGVP